MRDLFLGFRKRGQIGEGVVITQFFKHLAIVSVALAIPAAAMNVATAKSNAKQDGLPLSVVQEVIPSPSDILVTPPPDPVVELPAAPPVRYAKYKINYWNHAHRTCCKPVHILLEVKDPYHCMVQVPVNIPSCCQGAPHLSTGRDIFGRFSYTYQWRSGYKVDVVFRPRGDVMVHTWSR